jgi:aminopeptidase N
MKSLPLILLLLVLFIFSSEGQAPAARDGRQQVVDLIKEVQAQQAMIAANQTKLEAKVAEVAEAVRQARLYSSRSR